ncbi:MAG: HlyD family type I secretion periplasmic adaptor subunit [Xanthobacteraceae bacterium]
MLEKAPKTTSKQSAAKPAAARSFQPAALALEEDEPSRAHWWVLLTLTVFLLAAAVWASLAHVDRIVIARGELVTVTPALVVQPLERVGVSAVNVRVGDVVRKGQLLASLDPTFAQADVEQLRAKVSGYLARQKRLEAEIAGADYAPSAVPTRDESLEASLFNERKQAYAARMRAYQEELSKISATLATTRSDIEKAEARLALLQNIVEMRESLVAKAYDSQLRLLEAKAQLIATEREKIQAEGKNSELQHQVESTNAQRDAFKQEWREKVADELVTVRRDREAAAEELNKAFRRHDMVSLTAPEDAIVLEIAHRSIGSVLREAEILFTLVPLNAPLEAEVRISPLDIGLVKASDGVRIKLDAFPFQRHGTLEGTVGTISPDAFRPNRSDSGNSDSAKAEAATPFHKARVKLLSTQLRNVPDHYRLLPGMIVAAEIKVGDQRVISYLLWPIMKGLDESLREP